MAKKPVRVVKLQLKAWQANPAPPVGTALGPTGIQIADFCKQFNDKTKDEMGKILPVVINIYDDRTFDFYTKQPPATWFIKDTPNWATITAWQLRFTDDREILPPPLRRRHLFGKLQ